VLVVAVVVAMWRGGSGGGVGGGGGCGSGGGGVVAGGVPFGHPLPPKMSKIISITLSDKEVLLKKILSIILCYCTPITTTTPLLPFVMLPPLFTLYLFHLMLIVALLIFCSQCAGTNTVRTPLPHQGANTDAPTFPANALPPTPLVY
jgi:hypothetical protein